VYEHTHISLPLVSQEQVKAMIMKMCFMSSKSALERFLKGHVTLKAGIKVLMVNKSF